MYPRHILFPYQRKSSENLLSFVASNLLSPVDYTQNYSNTLPFSPYFLTKFIICDLCINKIVLFWPHIPLQILPLYLWSPLHENFSREHSKSTSSSFSPLYNRMWTENCQMYNLDFKKKKRQRNQRSNCQHPLDHGKSKRVPEKHLFLLYWLCQSLWLCGSQ